MAEKTPLYMDINNVYSGDEMGLPNRDFMSEGVVGANDYLVTAGAGNTVNIAAGACWILGDTDTVNQPIYRVINDAVVNKGITPDPTNPRIVLIIGQITDATFSGATRAMVLTALHGTPAGVPAAPALPASAILLSQITVPAAAASSAAYTIVDRRARARVGDGGAVNRTLAYGEVTASTNITVLANAATATQVVAAPTVITDGLTDIFIEFYSPFVQPPSVAGGRARLWLFDATSIVRMLALVMNPAATAMQVPVLAKTRLATPSGAAHTYSVRVDCDGAGAAAGSVGAGDPFGVGANTPAYIRVLTKG